MDRPSQDALTAAAALAARSHNRVTQIRRRFIERPSVAEITPLTRMLRGGRGGSVRLRLYLAMLWLAAAPPHDVAYPSRAWATLLDLDDPAGKGARRTSEAFKWLEDNDFVSVEVCPGHPNRVTLREETGTGRPYRVPGSAFTRARSRGAKPSELDRHVYVQLPPTFWTAGWGALLSPAAIAMLLILLAEQSGKTPGAELWFSPELALRRYSLSEDTRLRGIDELRRASLITVRRRPIASDVFDVKRFRNVYTLELEHLGKDAELPAADWTPLRPDGKKVRQKT